jgi:hypothetical protein
MENIQTSFSGQQTDERILYVIRPHDIALYIQLFKIYGLAIVVLISFFLLASLFPMLPMIGFVVAVLIAVIGTGTAFTMFNRQVAYVTDRRIVRFTATTPFATNARSLSWDDAVKVKTFPPNFIMKIFRVGNVVIHSHSTFVHTHETPTGRENAVSNDDIDLDFVYYYRDLGNYLDKIIYLIKHSPAELAELRPFVPKPKGQRY